MNLKDTIGVFPNTFTKNECDTLITYFEKQISENRAIHGYSSSGINGDMKLTTDYNIMSNDTNEDIFLRDMVIGKFNTALTEKYLNAFPHSDVFDHNNVIADKTFYPALNLQKYDQNKGHYNAWHTEKDHFQVSSRQFVFILYLNEVKEGGETEFLFKEEGETNFYGIKPEVGKLIIHPASWPYIHRGAMPKSNDKYILTTWLQFGDW